MRTKMTLAVLFLIVSLTLLTGVIMKIQITSTPPVAVVVKNQAVAVLPSEVNANCLAEGREDFVCLEKFYTDLVMTKGIATAFGDIKARYETSPAVKGYCHQLTHVIGHAGADLEGGVGAAFALGDPFCWSGFYHGVMEEIMKGVTLDQLPTKVNTVCADIPGKSEYSFLYFNCVHGLGHGLMQLFENNLFDSLTACSNLEGYWERDSCVGGVFMENIMIESRGGVSEYLKVNDPVYPCNAVSSDYKTPCYLMQTSHMLTASQDNFATVFALCSGVEDGYREICYQSLGRDASGRTSSNAEQTKATCMLGSDFVARSNCVIGAVKDFISYFHSDTEAKKFCVSLDTTLTDVCLSTAESYYKTF